MQQRVYKTILPFFVNAFMPKCIMAKIKALHICTLDK